MCVNSVTIDAVTQTKWVDYDVDLTNNKLIFATAFDGTQQLIIDYDYNTNGYSWIHPSNPERDVDNKLARSDYPRISVSELDSSGNHLGFLSDKTDSSVIFQIDVATKNKLKATDYVRVKTDGTTETVSESSMNSMLIDVLTMNLTNAIKRNWRTHIKPVMYPSENMFKGTTEVTIDNDIGLFRRVIDIQMKGFDLGERS